MRGTNLENRVILRARAASRTRNTPFKKHAIYDCSNVYIDSWLAREFKKILYLS